MSICDECFELRQPHVEVCPCCGKQTFIGQVKGISVVWECSTCGYGVASSGGCPLPCCEDPDEYSVLIPAPKDNKNLLKICKVFNENALKMKQTFAENGDEIERKGDVRACLAILLKLKKQGVECKIDEELETKYVELTNCPHVRDWVQF